MKSVVIQQPNALEIEERPLPLPGAGDVRVKIKLAGICGSDSHIYRGHTGSCHPADARQTLQFRLPSPYPLSLPADAGEMLWCWLPTMTQGRPSSPW